MKQALPANAVYLSLSYFSSHSCCIALQQEQVFFSLLLTSLFYPFRSRCIPTAPPLRTSDVDIFCFDIFLGSSVFGFQGTFCTKRRKRTGKARFPLVGFFVLYSVPARDEQHSCECRTEHTSGLKVGLSSSTNTFR